MTTSINKKILTASAVGSAFEYYDFLVFGSLLIFFGKVFFPANSEITTFLISLATLGVGLLFRPIGAIIFGRLGDTIGRKKTFLITVLIMGFCTTLIGLVPGYDTIGWFAPLLVILLRIGQGIAVGGEYGGAITYIAEHTTKESRGFYTSIIQSTIHVAFGLTLCMILFFQWLLPPAEFAAWGWRLPFVVSVILLAISAWLRMSLNESPEFAKLVEQNNVSTAPVKDSLTDKHNLKFILLSLFGVLAGVGVVSYTTMVYLTFYYTKVLHISAHDTFVMLALSQLVAVPATLLLGKLSDKIGRLPIILTGMCAAVAAIVPMFMYLTSTVNPTLANVATLTDSAMYIAFGITCAFMLIHALVFAPTAAFLTEIFPARVRYTSMAIPLIGINWFGGLQPLITSWVISTTGDMYSGFIYPIGIASISIICILVFFKQFEQQQELITSTEIK